MSQSPHGTPIADSLSRQPREVEAKDAPLSLFKVLHDEFNAIHGTQPWQPASPKTPDEHSGERLRQMHRAIHALPTKRSALCLSGGGIRSASFGLGVLQALSNLHLLDKFDYLSTVSGGGYIGSWLTAWVHRENKNRADISLRLKISLLTEAAEKELTAAKAIAKALRKGAVSPNRMLSLLSSNRDQVNAAIDIATQIAKTLKESEGACIATLLSRAIALSVTADRNIHSSLTTPNGDRKKAGGMKRAAARALGESLQKAAAAIETTGILTVQNALKTNGARTTISPTEPEHTPIRWLRDYSNYLTPTLGFFSADSWTMIGTFLRNLLVNWLVLIPLLVAACMVPRLHIALIRITPEYQSAWLPLLVGLACTCASLVYLHYHRPGLMKWRCGNNDPTCLEEGMRFSTQGWFLLLGLLPLLVGMYGLTTAWAWHRNTPGSLSTIVLPGLQSTKATFAATGAAAHLIGWLVAITLSALTKKSTLDSDPVRTFFFIFLYGIVVVVSGALGGYLLWAILDNVPSEMTCTGCDRSAEYLLVADYAEWYGVFGVPGLLMLFLLTATLFIALSTRYTSDQDNEYWARTGSWILNAEIVLAALGSLIVFGPGLVAKIGVWTSASVGGLAGIVSLIGGFSAKTMLSESDKKDRTSSWVDLGVRIAMPLFIALLIVGLAWGTSHVVRGWSMWLEKPSASDIGVRAWSHVGYRMPEPSEDAACPKEEVPLGTQTTLIISPTQSTPCVRQPLIHSLTLHNAKIWPLLKLWGTLLIFGCLMGVLVNINKFSLHGFYRNRLIRAYLGASRPAGRDARIAHPLTGFDQKDNLYMAELGGYNFELIGPQQPRVSKPFHVVNIALNLVRADKLAWQQRKAQSFTVSPLHCGSWQLEGGDGGYRPSAAYGYNRSAKRAISLGTAMAISGAAASPNMGYHSSAAVTFLMALFNIRLGWWLGNPCRASYTRSHPLFSVRPLIDELFGWTGNQTPYVYLSDGGHFENLGLYEMVLRRCHTIVVVDAGCDDASQFSDLGNAIRKIRIDLGIEIEINTDALRPSTGSRISQWHHAIGTIRYDVVDDGAPVGTLVYLKPSLNGTEPSDIREYADHHPTFPHEPTSDQFFDESQFESYRRLGEHIGMEVFEPGAASLFSSPPGSQTIPEIVHKLEEHWTHTQHTDQDIPDIAASLTTLQQQLRQDGGLEALDRAIFPELSSVFGTFGTTMDPLDARGALHTCAAQVQLMERVYRLLKLRTETSLPQNIGWMNLFQRWVVTDQFQQCWPIVASTVSPPFREWAAQHLHLAIERESFTISPSTLTAAESTRIIRLAQKDTVYDDSYRKAFEQALQLSFPIFENRNTLAIRLKGGMDRAGELIGLSFVREEGNNTPRQKVLSLFLWVHLPYRTFEVQRELCGATASALKNRAQQDKCSLLVHVDLGKLGMPISPRKHPQAVWIRILEQHGFTRLLREGTADRLLYQCTYNYRHIAM